MITADREPIEESRGAYALALLESSGYVDPWKEEIAEEIRTGSADDVEVIIQDLLMNQVDTWDSNRLKDINRRLNRHDI